ncbi:unnamed protein product [Penicillium salamii]|uniref:Uncharacterized protein n=1 Tax=Penicillium salamii TaxID=1612424 RepID=A0A9W4NQ11_9EURO|nr:unnamed protein product [Penicillium salamii]CAG8139200.1 unnamed protein product [Penicillium salamii]CAG8156356.1 unnamed protein product [Penicillium salamii]CAG8156871.1 unnamed protein product [Penicillium salamii]CAG8158360.1 unnamed protein product [Penicillium salamii]
MSSFWEFETTDYNGAGSNIDRTMESISSDGQSAAALVLANLVAERMRDSESDPRKFKAGGEVYEPGFLREFNDPKLSELREMASTMDPTKMSKELLMLVLPLLLHVDTQSPTPEDIHALHEFSAGLLTAQKNMVDKWLRQEPAKSTLERAFKTKTYPDFKEAYRSRAAIAKYNASQTDLRYKAVESYAYQFVQACQCTDCLQTVMKLGLISFRSYGQDGKSLLHAAIQGGHNQSIAFAIDGLMNLGLDPRHLPTSIEGMSIPHHVASLHEQEIFKEVVMRLRKAGYPLMVWNDDGLKLELCSFITADTAEWLLSEGFNITKLPRNTLPPFLPSSEFSDEGISNDNDWTSPPGKNWNTDAVYGDPIIRKDPFEYDTFDANTIQLDGRGVTPIELRPTSRTVWHRAIENPQGPEFLDWLLNHSHTQPSCRSDFDRDSGETALVLAAKGNEPACIDWLCENCDPMAAQSTNPTSEEPNTFAYAMKTAAHSVQPSCAAILYAISNYAPDELYRDLMLVKHIYWLVIKAYRDTHLKLESSMNPGQSRMKCLVLLRNITMSKIKVLNTRMQINWRRWVKSVHFKWLLQFCSLHGYTFLSKDMKSGISFDLKTWHPTAMDYLEVEGDSYMSMS